MKDTLTTLLVAFIAVVAMSTLIDGYRAERIAKQHCAALYGRMAAYGSVCVVDRYTIAPEQKREAK